ncbi:ankyrin repeat protein [Oesophagostomum dentatum]|uniref:Ankyrin repeat protein n=1 Tax=Oesophagostomum dentatum TaxID=61180 RepID=A0A0B1TQR2_OESDE|nr:ankyrin repeat protein [Oesophagostomum dentatum]
MHFFDAAEDENLDMLGEIPLHWAARNGHANVVALLANEHINVNALNRSGESALLIASRYGHVDVVQALLERGANAAIRDQIEHSHVHCIKSHSQTSDALKTWKTLNSKLQGEAFS